MIKQIFKTFFPNVMGFNVVDYTQGTYHGGYGLPDISYEGQSATQQVFNSAPSVISSIGSFLTNPVGGLVTGGLGIIGKGIGAWLKYKQDKEDKAEAKARYNEQMRIQKEQRELQEELARKQLKMSEATFRANAEQARFDRNQYIDDKNFKRQTDWKDKLLNSMSNPDVQSKLSLAYGGR